MKSILQTVILSGLFLFGLCCRPGLVQAADPDLQKDSRCAVCGMFVAKYPNWLVKARMSDGEIRFFDGVKDAMVFYFAPQKYGAASGSTIRELLVSDYYTLKPVDARQAVFVVGSDVTGPMGHELIPFVSQEAAESFRADHHGKNIVPFEAITLELIEGLRAGTRMK